MIAFRRALFIRFGGVGDILLTTPSLRATAGAFPGIQIDFVVGGGMADALAGHPSVRRILRFDKRGADPHMHRFVPFLWDLRRQHYDLVVNFHPSAKSHLMAAASRARTTLTFQKRMEVRPETGRVLHAVDDFAKELLPLGISAVADRRLDFHVPDAARERVDGLLVRAGVGPGTQVVVINPAASRPLNRWPSERFGAVAGHFAGRPGVAVVVTGAPPAFRTVMDGLDEVALAARVVGHDPRILNLAGRLSVKEFGALLSRADALVTCDTGPMHIGAALGTPLVVLSGAADPDRTGPLTANSVVLTDRTLACVPCRARTCARGDVLCMENIAVGAVVAAAERHLAASRGAKRSHALPVIA